MLRCHIFIKRIGTGFIILFLILLMNLRTSAQTLEVGLFGGGSYYIGDLNPSMPFKGTGLAYGLLARYNLDTRWAVKFGVTRGTVKADAGTSNYLPERKLVFESPVTDISAVVEFNFFQYFTGSKYNWITPYIFAGAGAFMFEPVADGVSLQKLGTEGQNIGYLGRKPYSTVAISFPFGMGVKMSLTKRLCLGVYWELHKTLTDYLDDVSTTYYLYGPAINPDVPEEHLSDPAGTYEPGMQRGNADNNDWYSFAGVTLTYKFNLHSSRKCRDNEKR